jgi:hypothetical protein
LGADALIPLPGQFFLSSFFLLFSLPLPPPNYLVYPTLARAPIDKIPRQGPPAERRNILGIQAQPNSYGLQHKVADHVANNYKFENISERGAVVTTGDT